MVAFSSYINEKTLERVREILTKPEQFRESAEKNYTLGSRYLSYEMLEEKLELILTNIYGA